MTTLVNSYQALLSPAVTPLILTTTSGSRRHNHYSPLVQMGKLRLKKGN